MVTKVVLFRGIGKHRIVFFQNEPGAEQLTEARRACGPIERMQDIVLTGALEEIMKSIYEPVPGVSEFTCELPSTLALEWGTAFFIAGWNAVRERVCMSGPERHPEIMDDAKLRTMSTRKEPKQLLDRFAAALTCSGVDLNQETIRLAADDCAMFLVACMGAGVTSCFESPSYG